MKLKVLDGLVGLAALAALVLCGCNVSGIEVSANAADAVNITPNSAFISMQYSANNASIVEVGVVYGTLAGNLNVDAIRAHNGVNTAEFGIVSGTSSVSGRFDADLTGLSSSTAYYYKAFIKIDETSKEEYPHGYFVPFEYKSFQTPADNSPSVLIGDVTDISGTTAILTATVVKTGNPPYTEKGFCYGKDRNPAIGNSIKVEVTGTASTFTHTLNDLTTKTTYYVRAYILNGEHPVQYSAEKEFTTLSAVFTDPEDGRTYRIETFGADTWMVDDYVRVGWEAALTVCPEGWHLPSINEVIALKSVLTSGESVSDYFPTGIDWWTSDNQGYGTGIEGAYFYNGQYGLAYNYWPVWYGHEYAVRCVQAAGTSQEYNPSVSISDVTDVSADAAVFTATVTRNGNPRYTEKGFCYGTSRNPTIESGIKVEVTGTASTFTHTPNDLTGNTTYYVRAYILNGEHSVQYSEEKEFSTNGTFTDPVDGRSYRTVTFGADIWMIDDYQGKRFTWEEASTACPVGWRLPSSTDVSALGSVLGNTACDYFPTGQIDWWTSDTRQAFNSNTNCRIYRNSSISSQSSLSFVRYVKNR